MSIRRFACWVYALIWASSSLMLAGPVSAQAAAQVGASASPAPSQDDEEKARAHFRLGRAYYDNGDFAQAAVEFESAYRISQRSALLYNIYLAYRDASDTRHAAQALRKYLELEQKVENRGQLESRLAALERSLAEDSPATPQPMAAKPAAQPAGADPNKLAAGGASALISETPPASLSAAPAASAPSRSHANRPSQIFPLVLMGSGGAMVLTSVITGVMTLGKKSDLTTAQDQCQKLGNCQSLTPTRVAELDAAKRSGKTLALVTDVLLFGGLAVAGTGAVLFFLNRGREEKPSATTASLACAPGACLGSLRTRF
jgi:tetratricopeptide (TPR) repeat protein